MGMYRYCGNQRDDFMGKLQNSECVKMLVSKDTVNHDFAGYDVKRYERNMKTAFSAEMCWLMFGLELALG